MFLDAVIGGSTSIGYSYGRTLHLLDILMDAFYSYWIYLMDMFLIRLQSRKVDYLCGNL